MTLATDGSFTYTPDAGFFGTDAFTYTASDGEASDTATVTITVYREPNVPPVAVDDAYDTDEDTQLVVAAPGVLGNDSDANADAMAAVASSEPGHGTLGLTANGAVTYTPDVGFVGIDTFTYVASDPRGGSDTATVNPVVDPLDDPFPDDDGSIFETDIEWLAAQGITRGCNPPLNTLFCPDDLVTRGQMAAFLVRALGYTDVGDGDLFTDDDDSIFEADIDKLATAGVTRGCNPPTNDHFCPESFASRGQMAAFLHRALGG